MKITDEMTKALAAYSGPVTVCEPGPAQGKWVKRKPKTKAEKLIKRATKFLDRHRRDVDPEAERQRRHTQRVTRQRLAERNKLIVKQRERKYRPEGKFNKAEQ